jgi:hypothetical protein
LLSNRVLFNLLTYKFAYLYEIMASSSFCRENLVIESSGDMKNRFFISSSFLGSEKGNVFPFTPLNFYQKRYPPPLTANSKIIGSILPK